MILMGTVTDMVTILKTMMHTICIIKRDGNYESSVLRTVQELQILIVTVLQTSSFYQYDSATSYKCALSMNAIIPMNICTIRGNN